MDKNLNIKPTAGYALIEPLEIEKKTAAGIVLPDTHEEKGQKGKVVAIGKPLKKFIPEFKKGDTVIYKKWGGDEFKLDAFGKELIFVKHEDVLAIISKK
jgi:chaperonin GroES